MLARSDRSFRWTFALAFVVEGLAVPLSAQSFSTTPSLPWPPVATFSILGYDPQTGEVGGAVQSRVFSVGNGVLWAEADIGVVATQAIVDVSYGPQAIALLRQGMKPVDVVKKVWADDPDPRPSDWTKQGRQFAVIDAQGNVAAYTGPKASDWAGDKQGAYCTAQGNILAGPNVVNAMVAAFESTPGHLSLRLLAALEAGQAAGGDKRGMQSAAMVIVKKKGGVWLNNDVVLRLQVDDNPEPIKEMRRLVEKAAGQRRPPRSESMASTNVILVITDGLRWQELFGGADSTLIGPMGRVADTAGTRRAFWRPTADARRSTLMPFIWGTMATAGQVFGDSTAGSTATVTNGLKFSYPGYSEAFTGHVDARIDSNEYPPNPNRTVFEFLNQQPSFTNRVAAFATWSAFRRIINTGRSGVPVYDGWDNAVAETGTATSAALRAMQDTHTRLWPDNTWDAITHSAAVDYIAAKKPRVLFIGYGETDEWAHDGRYDMYLQSAHQVDAYLASLWQQAQSNPETRNRTTLIVTTDHGRGTGPKWRDHGAKVDGAERIWAAVMGPDVPALGVRRATPTTQSQIAGTIAAALGYNWKTAEPKAAPPLPAFGNRVP